MCKGVNGIYNRFIKRFLDIICAVLAMVVFSWLYVIVALLVRIKLGSPVIYKQQRPGKIDKKTGKEKIFNIYKFTGQSKVRSANKQVDFFCFKGNLPAGNYFSYG